MSMVRGQGSPPKSPPRPRVRGRCSNCGAPGQVSVCRYCRASLEDARRPLGMIIVDTVLGEDAVAALKAGWLSANEVRRLEVLP